MSRDSSGAGALFVSLGAQRVEAAAQARGRWVEGSTVTLAIDPPSGPGRQAATLALAHAVSQAGEALRRRPEAPALRELHVRVADCWLTWATVPWSDDLADPATANPALRAHLAGTGCPCDDGDALCVDDAAYGQPRVMVRFPAAVLEAVSRLAAGLGLPLRSLRPLGVSAWAAMPRGGVRALVMLEEGCTAVLQGGRRIGEVLVRGQVTDLAEGRAPVHALQGLWNRLRARDAQLAAVPRLWVLDLAAILQGEALPEGLQALEWPAPPHGLSPRLHLAALDASRHHGLDAVPAAVASPRWLRWAAAASVAAALLGGLEAWQLARQAQAAQAEWVALREAPAPVLRQAPWSREDLARVAAVNAAVRELNLPISALLAALQPPADLRVAVLGVDVASGTPAEAGGASRVKISAQAVSGADMARYVAYVARRRPFDGAYLVRHEIAMEVPERPWRFTVEASWKD